MSDLFDRHGTPTSGLLQALATEYAGDVVADAIRISGKRNARARIAAELLAAGTAPNVVAQTILAMEEEIEIASLDRRCRSRRVGFNLVDSTGKVRLLGVV